MKRYGREALGLLAMLVALAIAGATLRAEVVTPQVGTVSTTHNFLSVTHPDTTAAAATRGDIVTAQGASPVWAALAKGAQYKVLSMGANEPAWAAHFTLDRTVTGAGTTGNQTINKEAGTVNLAALAASIVVTNNTVDTSSIVFTTIRTADATCTAVTSAVPTANTITITMNAACTAETSVGFAVTN